MQTPAQIEVNAERNPIVDIRDGEVTANSRDVAAFFGKDHRNVLQAIDNLIEQDGTLTLTEFSAGVYRTQNTGRQEHRCFTMNRDGFSLLAMGFTGAKALKWKRAYIHAFNAMEEELRRRADQGQAVDLNDPAALRGLLLSYSEKAEALQQQVEELMPSQRALDRIAEADGSICITSAAKHLQMRPKDLFAWMRQNGWIYKRTGSVAYLGYSSKTQAGLLEHKVTTVHRSDGSEKITEQVRVTPKGLTRLAKVIRPALEAVH